MQAGLAALAEGDYIYPLAQYAGLELLASAAARHGSNRGTYMPAESFLRKRAAVTPDEPQTKRQRTYTYAPRVLNMPAGVMTRTRRTVYKYNLGTRVGKFKCNKFSFKTGVTNNMADKAKHSFRLIQIPYSSDDSLFNTRNGRLVNVRGVRLQWVCELKPGGSTGNIEKPLSVRWAIINPKENDGTSTVGTANWWTSLNPTNEYATDFVNGSGSTTPGTGTGYQDWFDLMTRGINRRKYGVLKEGHFTISPPETSDADSRKTWRQQKVIQTYLKINQCMKWGSNNTGGENDYPNANLYFVWWYCDRGNMDDLQWYPSVNYVPLQTQAQVTVFFKTAKGLL